jgi:hypothetical protein
MPILPTISVFTALISSFYFIVITSLVSFLMITGLVGITTGGITAGLVVAFTTGGRTGTGTGLGTTTTGGSGVAVVLLLMMILLPYDISFTKI